MKAIILLCVLVLLISCGSETANEQSTMYEVVVLDMVGDTLSIDTSLTGCVYNGTATTWKGSDGLRRWSRNAIILEKIIK